MVSHKSQETDVLSVIAAFLSLTLTSLSSRIPTAAETIIYISVVNIKAYPCWKQTEKYRNKKVTFGFKKSQVLGRGSKMNTENTHFTHIYLRHLTTTLRKALYLSSVHIFLPLQCQQNPCQQWLLHRPARKGKVQKGVRRAAGEYNEADPW